MITVKGKTRQETEALVSGRRKPNKCKKTTNRRNVSHGGALEPCRLKPTTYVAGILKLSRPAGAESSLFSFQSITLIIKSAWRMPWEADRKAKLPHKRFLQIIPDRNGTDPLRRAQTLATPQNVSSDALFSFFFGTGRTGFS